MITVRQPSFGPVPPLADGFTHASSVMPVESESDALLAMLTMALTPSNESAPPKPVWPVTRVAPTIVPLFALPDESLATLPDASLNDIASTGPAPGGGVGAGPSEIVSATALPTDALEPSVGVWLITDPARIVDEKALVIPPTATPMPVIAVCAAACVMPTTVGTVTLAGATPAVTSTAAKFH